MANMFETATVVAPKKKSSKPEALVLDYGSEADQLAAVTALLKTLESAKDVLAASIKAKAQEKYVELGEAGLRPANFKVSGKMSLTSCELRKRSTTSPLTAEEAVTLAAAGITVDRKTEDVFVFNSAMLKNRTMMERISDALQGVELTDEFEGQTIVQRHVAPSIVGENAVEEVFALKDAAEIARLLPLVSVLGLKPKLNTQNMDEVLAIVKDAGIALE